MNPNKCANYAPRKATLKTWGLTDDELHALVIYHTDAAYHRDNDPKKYEHLKRAAHFAEALS